eukprot:COSAG05_NODE_1822_length_4012_cov_18.291592_3_plen_55_part_00
MAGVGKIRWSKRKSKIRTEEMLRERKETVEERRWKTTRQKEVKEAVAVAEEEEE